MIKALISGHFNVLHSGHLRLFKFAKNRSDKLIIILLKKPSTKGKDLLPLKTRSDVLKSCSLVDKLYIIDDVNQLPEIILKIKPNIIVKGSEFKFKNNIEEKFIDKRKIKLLFSSGEKINLKFEKKKIFKEVVVFEKEFLQRNNINLNQPLKVIDKFKELSVCVVGDIIIDEYSYHEPLGMSQEDYSIVVKPLDEKKYLGGAGIVAAHASALKAKSKIISIIGKDNNGEFVKNKLRDYGVKNLVSDDRTRQTTLKKRIKVNNSSLLRINNFTEDFINEKTQKNIYDKINRCIDKIDVLIFSDFNYGILPEKLINKIIKLCKKNSVVTCADSQLSSQVGDITRFKNVDIFSQTEYEVRSSLKNNNDGLVKIMNDFANITRPNNLLLKLGEQGLLINQYSNEGELFTDKLESFNKLAVDPSGAGDSLLVASAMAYAITKNIWISAYIGNIAASVQVSREGNIPITYKEMLGLLFK